MGNIHVKINNRSEAIICDILYVPSTTSNLISLGQLLDKDYKMRLEWRGIKVVDERSKLILKASLSTNRTFKIMINMLDHQFLASPRIEIKIRFRIRDMVISTLEVLAWCTWRRWCIKFLISKCKISYMKNFAFPCSQEIHSSMTCQWSHIRSWKLYT